MSWTDGLNDSDTLLPFFGFLGLVVFIIICLFTYCQHKEVIKNGTSMVVIEIGTCTSDKCVIRVKSNDAELTFEKIIKGSVFVGDTVICSSEICYKD